LDDAGVVVVDGAEVVEGVGGVDSTGVVEGAGVVDDGVGEVGEGAVIYSYSYIRING